MNRLICAILFLLMIAPIAAQDAAPYPVLDEAAIFADGVTVIERLPDIRVNNETRELYYLAPDATEWETYSYPDAIQEDLEYRWEFGSRVFVFSEGFSYGLNTTVADWLFTPPLGLI